MSPSTGNCLLPADSAPLFAIVDRSSPGQGWRGRRSRCVRRLPHQRMQQIQHLSERVHIQGSHREADEVSRRLRPRSRGLVSATNRSSWSALMAGAPRSARSSNAAISASAAIRSISAYSF
jgi:hypothetical protein